MDGNGINMFAKFHYNPRLQGSTFISCLTWGQIRITKVLDFVHHLVFKRTRFGNQIFSEMSRSFEYQTMDEIQEFSNPKCNIVIKTL